MSDDSIKLNVKNGVVNSRKSRDEGNFVCELAI